MLVGLDVNLGGDAFAKFSWSSIVVSGLENLRDEPPRNLPTPVDQRQKPIGSSLVMILPFSAFCVKMILSG